MCVFVEGGSVVASKRDPLSQGQRLEDRRNQSHGEDEDEKAGELEEDTQDSRRKTWRLITIPLESALNLVSCMSPCGAHDPPLLPSSPLLLHHKMAWMLLKSILLRSSSGKCS